MGVAIIITVSSTILLHPVALGPFLCRFVSSTGEWRVGFLDFLASCPFPHLCPESPLPLPAGPQGACCAWLKEGAGHPSWHPLPQTCIRALTPSLQSRGAGLECPGRVLQGLKEAAGGLLAGSGKGEGGGGAPVARPPPLGEGAGRAAPSLSCSQQWPWDQLCSLRPLPAWTQGSLTPSSRQPASCQPQLQPHHCPPPRPVSPDTHPTQ